MSEPLSMGTQNIIVSSLAELREGQRRTDGQIQRLLCKFEDMEDNIVGSRVESRYVREVAEENRERIELVTQALEESSRHRAVCRTVSRVVVFVIPALIAAAGALIAYMAYVKG
jgi:hypothetical protein